MVNVFTKAEIDERLPPLRGGMRSMARRRPPDELDVTKLALRFTQDRRQRPPPPRLWGIFLTSVVFVFSVVRPTPFRRNGEHLYVLCELE